MIEPSSRSAQCSRKIMPTNIIFMNRGAVAVATGQTSATPPSPAVCSISPCSSLAFPCCSSPAASAAATAAIPGMPENQPFEASYSIPTLSMLFISHVTDDTDLQFSHEDPHAETLL